MSPTVSFCVYRLLKGIDVIWTENRLILLPMISCVSNQNQTIECDDQSLAMLIFEFDTSSFWIINVKFNGNFEMLMQSLIQVMRIYVQFHPTVQLTCIMHRIHYVFGSLPVRWQIVIHTRVTNDNLFVAKFDGFFYPTLSNPTFYRIKRMYVKTK